MTAIILPLNNYGVSQNDHMQEDEECYVDLTNLEYDVENDYETDFIIEIESDI